MAGSESHLGETAPRKEKPDAVGVGSGLFSYRSLRFQVCGLAAGLEAVIFVFVQSSQPIFVVVTALGLSLFFLLLFLIVLLTVLI